jgi:hypothetical protein
MDILDWSIETNDLAFFVRETHYRVQCFLKRQTEVAALKARYIATI